MKPTQAEALRALLDKLDPDQKKIATWTPMDGNMRVVACAGAGKTTTTVALAANLLREGHVPPSALVLTTFSRKAGEELKQRLGRVVDDDLLEEVRVGTFHSLALRALRSLDPARWDLKKCVDLDSRTRAATTPSTQNLWRAICVFGTIPGTNQPSLKLTKTDPREYTLAVDLFRAHGHNKPADVPVLERNGPLAWDKAWNAYLAAKKVLGVWDFADALSEWLRALESGQLRTDARVVIVDEAQDNNRVQLSIARALAGESGRIILVGDLRQTIHVWRGSFPALFAAADIEIGAKTREIPTNYRSLGPIVELGNRIAAGRPWALGEPAKAARGDGEDPGGVIDMLPGAITQDAEAERVARRIAEEIDAGTPAGSFAILTRTNASRAYFEAALNERDIPTAVLGGSSIFRTRESEVVLAYCALAQHDAIGSLERVLNTPKRFLPNTFTREVANVLPACRGMAQAIRAAAMQGTLKGGSQRGAIELSLFIERLRAMPWEKVPETVSVLLTARDDDAPAKEATDEDSPAIYEAVCRIARRFPSAADLIDFAQKCLNGTSSLPEGERAAQRVTLATVHRAKGLEWEHVYVSATEGVFPHERAALTDLEDERRLFYVAVTRAVNRLTFSYAEVRGTKKAGRSRFLSALSTGA